MTVEAEELFIEIWNMWTSGKITKSQFDEYVENYINNFISGSDLVCLNNRRDKRSFGEFFRQIDVKTGRQNALMFAWALKMTERGHDIKFLDNGADNSGRPILRREKLSKNADYIISLDDKEWIPVDVKEITDNSKLVLKVADLKTFIQQKALILVFWKTGKVDKEINKETEWAIFGNETLNSMLTLPHKKYSGINGSRLSVKIDPIYYNKLFEVYSLFDLSKKFFGISNFQVDFKDINEVI